MTGVPIVTVATGYTAASGARFILIFNESLWIPELENSLMNPNQLRHFGIEVQDNPFHKDPIIIRKEEDSGGFVACLKSSGTNIFIDTWTPSERDLSEYPQIVLTDSEPWNPHIVSFPGISELEAAELEGRNVSSVVYDLRGEESNPGYGDPYHEAMRVFDLPSERR